jgi:DNA polymerase III subunit delta
MQTLNQDIKNNDFKKVYLLFGEEAFLKKSYKNRLREAITQGDTMNYNYYEGKGINVNEIISLSDTMPFFADRRLILMEDSGWFKGGPGADEMCAYIENIPDTTCLLFVETEVDKRSRMYKAVKKYVQQLIREIRAQSCYCTDCQVVSVFIGGGTPSLLEPSCISRIMETVFSCFQVEPEAEIVS